MEPRNVSFYTETIIEIKHYECNTLWAFTYEVDVNSIFSDLIINAALQMLKMACRTLTMEGNTSLFWTVSLWREGGGYNMLPLIKSVFVTSFNKQMFNLFNT